MKMACRQRAWSVGLAVQRRDVSVARKSKLANQKHRRLFVHICSQSQYCDASKCWKSVFDLATDVSVVCMCGVFVVGVVAVCLCGGWMGELWRGRKLTTWSEEVSNYSHFWITVGLSSKKTINCPNSELSENIVWCLGHLFADEVLGIVIFLCKFYIYRCKWQEIVPSRNTVLKILKDKHTVKKNII